MNFEVPFNREAYVHRVGRAGRAGSTGTAITLVSPDERHDMEEIADAFGLVLFEDAHAELVEAGEAIDGAVEPPVEPRPRRGRAAAARPDPPSARGRIGTLRQRRGSRSRCRSRRISAPRQETEHAETGADTPAEDATGDAAKKRRRRRRRRSGPKSEETGESSGSEPAAEPTATAATTSGES